LRSLFFTPPLAVARLGSSATPVDAYIWREDPSVRGGGLTSLEPAVSLRVRADGSISSARPRSLVFRDGDLLRPVAPFLELWVELEDGGVRPLTSALLTKLGGKLADVSYVVEAANRKAARRSGDPACAFAATVAFDHTIHTPTPLPAASSGAKPLVSPVRPIPLGTIQPLRPVPGPPDIRGVDADVLRLRFTPAKGKVYGPPTAVEGQYTSGGPGPPLKLQIVAPENRILNEGTAWTDYTLSLNLPHPIPADTYDGSGDPTSPDDRSWGVVDDTCDVVITATLRIAGAAHVGQARIFVGPPDFAPDKRPFVSLVDEFLDRESPEPPVDAVETQLEVADLFRRVYETVSLNNIDLQRRRGLAENNANADDLVSAAETLGLGDHLRARLGRAGQPPSPPRADKATMTDQDVGFRAGDRNQLRGDTALPYSLLGRDAHIAMTALPRLLQFLTDDADRVRRLLRPPYAVISESDPASAVAPAGRRRPWDPEAWLHDMRMPPYMRDSDASPLSLTRRQYVQVMRLVDQLTEEAARGARLAADAGLAADPVSPGPPGAGGADELFAAFRRSDVTAGVPEPRP